MRIRSFVAWLARHGAPADGAHVVDGEDPRRWRSWHNGPLAVRYAPRDPAAPPLPASAELPFLLLGDDGALNAGASDAPLASAVPVLFEANSRALVVQTSIVALPPVFLYRGADVTAITSDLHLLAGLPGVHLEFDPAGVADLGRFGHPVGHRTLFCNLTLVPAGMRLTLALDGHVTQHRTWSMPEDESLSWAAFIEAQIGAFTEALRRTDVSGSFLSLTAGLDTRTVFAALADQGRLVPTATMTGARRSLDERIAGRLSAAYGVRHMPVVFDERFERDLPAYVEEANRLSGGLDGMNQAPEVFLYRQLGEGYRARLSGNLGNQVGRGGTEGVSLRDASLDVLSPRLRADRTPAGHWLLEELAHGGRDSLEFILQQEVPFTMVANFGVGNHFAAQQSPYADRALIETLGRRPLDGTARPSGSKVRMRVRDMKHRFLGEPASSSFQRSFVARLGGQASHIPINWGWRTTGGASLGGLIIGGATFAGMAARAKGLDDGALRGLMAWSGLPALHDFRESRRWLRERLRDFTMDSIRSAAVREADLFDWPNIDSLLEQHFSGKRDHYPTVTYVLSLALAHRQFVR